MNSSTINSVLEDYQSKCNGSDSACDDEYIGSKKYAIHIRKSPFYFSKYKMLEDVNVVNSSLTRYKIR